MMSSSKIKRIPRRSTAAQDLLLPGEDHAEYEALEAQYFADFDPQDALSEELVRDVVALVWKKRRLIRMEQRLLAHGMSAPLGEGEFSYLRLAQSADIERRVLQAAFDATAPDPGSLYKTYVFAATLLHTEEVTLEHLKTMAAQHPELWRAVVVVAI
jgi:hypothetical protein